MRNIVQRVHERGVQAMATYRKGLHELIDVIQEIDRLGGYRDFNRPSLWQYCLNDLKLDENEASMMTAIARKSVEVPELKSALQKGEIHFSKARRIVPILTAENKSQWLDNARHLTKRELERELAHHFPKQATVERAQYVAKGRVQFQCGLNEEDFQDFLDVQNLVCQKKQAPADYETTQVELIRFYKNAHDPVLKAKRAHLRKARRLQKQQIQQLEAPPQVPVPVTLVRETKSPLARKNKRNYSTGLKHQLNLRDERQCTHTDNNGNRCPEKRWLEFHHKISVEHGGPNTLDNLTTYCWGHHELVHNGNFVSDRTNRYTHDWRIHIH